MASACWFIDSIPVTSVTASRRDERPHPARTASTTVSISDLLIVENSGRLTRRVHTADATGRSAGRQPNVSS